MDSLRKIPQNLFSFRKQPQQTDAVEEKSAQPSLTEIVPRAANPVLGKTRGIANRLKTRSTPSTEADSGIKEKKATLSSHRRIAIDSDNEPPNKNLDDLADSSISINSSTNSNSEESLIHETKIIDSLRSDFIKGRRQPANTFDPRRRNFQKNHKAIDSIEVFSLTAKNKDKISSIRAHLPPGMNLDGRGTVFGSHVHMKTPSHAKLPDTPIEQALNQEMIERHLTTTDPGRIPRKIAGVMVVNACHADFHRTKYQFPTSDGGHAVLPWPSPEAVEIRSQERSKTGTHIDNTVEQELRKEQIAKELAVFVRDENSTPEKDGNAALVVSSVLHQGISTALSVIAFGEKPALKMLSAQATSSVGRNMTIKDSNGDTQPQEVVGLGNIVFTLSRRGDDFIVAADFPMYGEARDGHEEYVPLHQDGVVGIRAKMEMVINGAKARDGELALTIPGGVHVAYSGGLTF